MKSTKTHIIILLFLMYCTIAYFIISLLTKYQIDKNEIKDSGIIEVILAAVYKIIFGVVSYFLFINLSSIVGLIISIKRKDTLAIQAFKTTTILTAIVTFLYFFCSAIGV
ncbi:MAG: hypothetical protein H7331_09210 [Bacteroidia bacterium]|nr:hypothetical protein [Bacteroidia bacterium]